MEKATAGNLLERKRFCLERIKKIFFEQGICLDNTQIQLFLAKSQIVDRILNEIKVIDSELEQKGIGPTGKGVGGDLEPLTRSITELIDENQSALIEAESRLKKMRADIKSELNGVVSNGRISAYKPFTAGRPIYLDSRN